MYQAPIAQIHAAYKRKALQLHPDKNLNNPQALQDFQALVRKPLFDFYIEIRIDLFAQ
jgi:hypothetical protein